MQTLDIRKKKRSEFGRGFRNFLLASICCTPQIISRGSATTRCRETLSVGHVQPAYRGSLGYCSARLTRPLAISSRQDRSKRNEAACPQTDIVDDVIYYLCNKRGQKHTHTREEASRGRNGYCRIREKREERQK